MLFPSDDNKTTNLGLGLAERSTADPLIKDIQTHIDKLEKDKRWPSNKVVFGRIGPDMIISYLLQVWGANSNNIHVDTKEKLETYLRKHGSLGAGQAKVITEIIQKSNFQPGDVIGIDTMSPYIKKKKNLKK